MRRERAECVAPIGSKTGTDEEYVKTDEVETKKKRDALIKRQGRGVGTKQN